jgi:hypothetical protein
MSSGTNPAPTNAIPLERAPTTGPFVAFDAVIPGRKRCEIVSDDPGRR